MLGILNVNKRLAEYLSVHFTVADINHLEEDVKIQSLLVDWIPKSSKNLSRKVASNLLKQTETVEMCIKNKIPVVIFDRYLSISKKEEIWFIKHGVKLFEPAVNNRKNFKYLPFPVEIKEFKDVKLNEKDRNYPLAYKGSLSDKLKSFEKYYVKYAELYPQDSNIIYDSKIDDLKKEEYDNYGIEYKEDIHLSDAKCIVIIGSRREYRVGYISSIISEALENNCLPLIAEENRFFNALPFVVKNPRDISWYVDMYNNTYAACMIDLYNNIKRNYPEFDINNVTNILRRELK